jgi:hypothetical protein
MQQLSGLNHELLDIDRLADVRIYIKHPKPTLR